MKWDNLDKVLNTMGAVTKQVIQSDIQNKKIIRTGTLKRSIKYKVVLDSKGVPDIEFEMIDYGKYVDEGTKNIKARKFFKENVEKQLAKFKQRIAEAIAKDLKVEIIRNLRG